MNRWKKLYTVYDNKTDFPVVVDGTSEECARAMGIAFSTFLSYVSRAKMGRKTPKRWEILVVGRVWGKVGEA